MSRGVPSQIRDERQLRAELDRQARDLKRSSQEDVTFDAGRRLFVRSANGHFWKITVGDDGSLTTTDMGTSL